MSSEFDPYRVWLSIPASEQPANFYRLLGVALFESDPDVISGAADRQMSHVRTFQSGKHSELSQRILNELSQARITLLDQSKKAEYDARLHAELDSASVSNNVNSSASSIGVIGEMQSPSPPSADSLNEFANIFSPTHSNHVHTSKNKVKKIRKKTDFHASSNGKVEHSRKKSSLQNRWLIIGIAIIASFLLIVFLNLTSNMSFNSEMADNSELEDESEFIDESENLPQESVSVDLNRPAPLPVKRQQSVHKEPPRSAGERMVKGVNGVEFAFRWCPPGTFTMGSPKSEPGRFNNETQHQVTLTKGFWMLETEVTVGMFKAFAAETGYESKGDTPYGWLGKEYKQNSDFSWLTPGFSQDDNHPVTYMSWNDASAFCEWLSQKTGLTIELPTEAQWEYACRAGSTTALPNGNMVIKGQKNAPALDPIAWYSGNSSQGFVGNSSADSRNWAQTQYPGGPCGSHPVGKKEPNAWGLYDMIGNVWEWCNDWYGDYPNDNVTDPTGPSFGSGRIRRSGGWGCFNATDCRSASRGNETPEKRVCDVGFRCVISDSSPKAPFVATAQPLTSVELSNKEHKAGDRDVVTINGVEFAFRWCPPGTFMMGSPESEAGRENNETQHQVTLTKGFWMMETEVTQKQWKAVMGYNPSRLKSDGRPVESVSWNNCQDFCRKTGLHLPTEAQWEYACRAGTTGPYAGNLNEMAWYGGKGRHTVRSKKPNAWGLYDMHGNVWEWCQDKYGSYPKESVTDPIDTSSVAWRVRRSGGGSLSASKCRSASRGGREPNCHNNYTGFRCIKY